MPDTRSDEEKVKFCKDMLGIMMTEREQVQDEVDEVITFVNHSRRKIKDGGESSKGRRGKRTGSEVYDGTAMSAANIAADGIYGYICSESIRWFQFVLPGKVNFARTSGMRAWNGKRLDERLEVRQWLDDCEDVQYAAYRRSNFYNFAPDLVHEGISIGTATTIMQEDVGQGRIHFRLPHFRECYIAEDQFGVVDTLYRPHRLTLRQLVQKFGEDKVFGLKTDFKDQYEKNPHREKDILHATFPRADYDPALVNKKNKPIASFWILMEGDNGWALIDESGLDIPENRTWRWKKNVDEIYGRSPAWDAMVDIKRGNQQAKTNLIAGHKMVDPPTIAPEGLRGEVNYGPAGRSFIDGAVTKDNIPVPLLTGIQIPFGIDQQERTDKIIRDRFYVQYFMSLLQAASDRVEMTATQVHGMQAELAALLGARIGRFQFEGLSPIQDGVFWIETRAGKMPIPPPILEDMGWNEMPELDYLGPMAQSQKSLFMIGGIRAGLEIIGEIGQVYPQAFDKVNPDDLVDKAVEATGFPASVMNDDATVKAIRLQRQQQIAAQQAMEEIETASKASKNLSKTMEEGSPMKLLTEGGGA